LGELTIEARLGASEQTRIGGVRDRQEDVGGIDVMNDIFRIYSSQKKTLADFVDSHGDRYVHVAEPRQT
jgi:hypothetical protein